MDTVYHTYICTLTCDEFRKHYHKNILIMKDLQFAALIFIFCLFFYFNDKKVDQQTELIEQRFNELDSIMTHRSTLDSLYWNHLEECAFVLRENKIYSCHN